MSEHRDLVTEVVEALAAVHGESVDSLGYTLHDYIDPDVLVALEDADDTSWEFAFEVADHAVTVTSDGRLFVDGALVESDVLAEGAPE